jgi:hypothetical protein
MMWKSIQSMDIQQLKYLPKMAYLSHGVIAAGRFHYEPKNLGQKKLSKLKRNILLMNKVGKLLKTEPALVEYSLRKNIFMRMD